MSKFQDEMEQIRPSDALVQETMRRMHAENEKRKQAAESPVRRFPVARRALPVAAGFAVLLLAGWFALRVNTAPVTKLTADAGAQSAFASYRGQASLTEAPMDVAAFSLRTQVDFAALLPGYDCISSEIIAFTNAADERIIGDYAVFVYENGEKRVTVHASTTDAVAPAALLAGKPVQKGGTAVRFGSAEGGRVYLAAWSSRGTAFLARSDTLTGRAFTKSIGKAVEALAE